MIELRNYQKHFVRCVHDQLRAGYRRPLGVAPTGSGKRYILCWWMTQGAEQGKNVAMVTDRQILVEQAADECKEHGIPYGIMMGNVARNDDAPVQLCSIQTLKRRKYRDLPKADVLLIDEAHKESKAYQELADILDVPVIGVTATPVGANGRSLVNSGLFDCMVEPVRNEQLIQHKYLLPVEVHCPVQPDLKGVRVTGGDYNVKELAERVRECVVDADLFREYQKYSERQALVFAPGVIFARGLSDQFRDMGYRFPVIEAATPRDKRREYFDQFENRDIDGLISCDVLKEGFDQASASLGIDLQPTKQLRVYWQKVGRVKRPYEGQDAAKWLDFSGSSWHFPHPDTDVDWPLQSDPKSRAQDIVRKKREKEGHDPWQCKVCRMTLAPWQNASDGKCPNCGADIQRAKQRIKMSNGRLRYVGVRVKKVTITDHYNRVWEQCLWACKKKEKSIWGAVHMFKARTNQWPEGLITQYELPSDRGDYERSVGCYYKLGWRR